MWLASRWRTRIRGLPSSDHRSRLWMLALIFGHPDEDHLPPVLAGESDITQRTRNNSSPARMPVLATRAM
jgi:hypothetical protein